MKKLLILLMMIAMVAFLFGGCFLEPDDDEDEPVEPGEPGICPVVSVTSEVDVGGKNYIKGGKQTITVTFAVPTEPVSVYVGAGLRVTLEDLLRKEVVMYANADKTVYTGEFDFGKWNPSCSEAYIYVETCETCDYCKYPYTVDTAPPYVKLKVEVSGDSDDCPCGGCCMTISSVVEEDCDDVVCCGDDCSGLASWSFRLFDEYPWSECCDTWCEEPIFEDDGTDCPIKITIDCLDEGGNYYAILSLVDNVGNEVNVAGGFDLYVSEKGNGYYCELGYLEEEPPDACGYYEEYEFCWENDYPLIIIDPSGTIPEDCWCKLE